MKIEDIESVLDAIIKHHENERAKSLEPISDYKAGFLNGLQEAKKALIMAEKVIR